MSGGMGSLAKALIAAACFASAVPVVSQAAEIAMLARRADRLALPIPTKGTTLAPFAYILYCKKNPEDCRGGGGKIAAVEDDTVEAIGSVNRAVNRSIRPRGDGARDVWTVNSKAGDCEDYALTKRRELIARGLPASALRMAVAITQEGVGHAVLVVQTTKGALVLDNRTDRILPWNKSGLSWIKIASAENPRIWASM